MTKVRSDKSIVDKVRRKFGKAIEARGVAMSNKGPEEFVKDFAKVVSDVVKPEFKKVTDRLDTLAGQIQNLEKSSQTILSEIKALKPK